MQYCLLGPLEVRDGDRSLPLAGAKQRALLALLLVHANHVLSRDRLVDELWGEEPPETAVQSLQVYVSRLRKLLPAGALLTRPPGYLLEVEPDELDLRRFERLLAEGRATLAEGDARRAAAVLHEALALWRGPALAEFAFEPFAQAEIGRLEDLRLAAVEERIEADLALGRHADLIGELEALIAENPYRERLRGQLMLALYRSGRQTEALEAYRQARRALVDELGIEPSSDLQRIEKAILTHDAGLETPPKRHAVPTADGAAPPAAPPVERKRVTVLFADLTMTDEAAEDPQEAATFLDRLHNEAAAEIEAAGGTVEKGVAGVLLATFGAQSARRQDHAVRAVSAALATRNRLSDVFGDAFSLRMAVESGDVILGRPGSFVTGTPVVAAARLVRLAQAGEVVVGERAATATAGAFELQQRDGAYALVGALASARSPAQIARARTRRRLLLLAGALLAAAAIASIVAYVTRETPITVPPNSVGIIDPRTNKVVGHVPVGARPDGVAVGQGAVWVANLQDRTLSRVDSKQRTLERTISLNATPTGVAVGAGAVWLAYGLLGTLSRFAPESNQVTGTIQTPVVRSAYGARGVVAVGAGAVWVAYGGSTVSRIDPASMHVVFTTFAGNGPSAVAFGNGSLWVANAENSTVSRFNRPSYQLPVEINVGRRPSGVAVGGEAVWVTDTADDTVTRINPSTNSVTAISVGRAPVGVAYGGGAVWIANSDDGTVSRLDPSTNEVVATIAVGNSPLGIAVGAGAVWVTVQAAAQAT
jgi:YVTN family beta-propeller protein